MQHNFVALLIGGVNRGEPARDGMAVVLVLLGHVTLGDGFQGGRSHRHVDVSDDGADREDPDEGVPEEVVLENGPVPAGRLDVDL